MSTLQVKGYGNKEHAYFCVPKQFNKQRFEMIPDYKTRTIKFIIVKDDNAPAVKAQCNHKAGQKSSHLKFGRNWSNGKSFTVPPQEIDFNGNSFTVKIELGLTKKRQKEVAGAKLQPRSYTKKTTAKKCLDYLNAFRKKEGYDFEVMPSGDLKMVRVIQ